MYLYANVTLLDSARFVHFFEFNYCFFLTEENEVKTRRINNSNNNNNNNNNQHVSLLNVVLRKNKTISLKIVVDKILFSTMFQIRWKKEREKRNIF
jgi:hypothetical protein